MERKLQVLFGVKGSSPGFVENLKTVLTASSPALEPDLDELNRIANLLTGLEYTYQIDFTSGSGFEYYTGVIFGFYCSGQRLGGGGRYDELIPLVGGKDIPASGFALYIDELMALVDEPPQQDRILIKAKDDKGLKASLEAARCLRDAGYIAEFDSGYEEYSEFRWIVDMRTGKGIVLKDQVSGKTRQEPSISELLKTIEKAGRK